MGRDRSRYLDPKCTAASPEARGIVPPIVTAGLAGMPPLTAEQKANFMALNLQGEVVVKTPGQ